MTYGLGLYASNKNAVQPWRDWHASNLPDQPFPDILIGDLVLLIKEDNLLPTLESIQAYGPTRSKVKRHRDWIEEFTAELHRLVDHKIESRDHVEQVEAKIPHTDFRQEYVDHVVRFQIARQQKGLVGKCPRKELRNRLMRAMGFTARCSEHLLTEFRNEAMEKIEEMETIAAAQKIEAAAAQKIEAAAAQKIEAAAAIKRSAPTPTPTPTPIPTPIPTPTLTPTPTTQEFMSEKTRQVRLLQADKQGVEYKYQIGGIFNEVIESGLLNPDQVEKWVNEVVAERRKAVNMWRNGWVAIQRYPCLKAVPTTVLAELTGERKHHVLAIEWAAEIVKRGGTITRQGAKKIRGDAKKKIATAANENQEPLKAVEFRLDVGAEKKSEIEAIALLSLSRLLQIILTGGKEKAADLLHKAVDEWLEIVSVSTEITSV